MARSNRQTHFPMIFKTSTVATYYRTAQIGPSSTVSLLVLLKWHMLRMAISFGIFQSSLLSDRRMRTDGHGLVSPSTVLTFLEEMWFEDMEVCLSPLLREGMYALLKCIDLFRAVGVMKLWIGGGGHCQSITRLHLRHRVMAAQLQEWWAREKWRLFWTFRQRIWRSLVLRIWLPRQVGTRSVVELKWYYLTDLPNSIMEVEELSFVAIHFTISYSYVHLA